MIPRQPRILKNAFWVAVVLGCLLEIPPVARAEDAPKVLMQTSEISILLGYYSVKTNLKTISGVGALGLGYTHHFTLHLSATIAYQNFFATQGSIESVVSGFDMGGNYCFFSCTSEVRSLGGLVQMTERDRIGVLVGVGFAQRFFQSANNTANYSGTYLRVQPNYFLTNHLKVLVEGQYTALTNSVDSIKAMTFSVGVGFLLGAPSE